MAIDEKPAEMLLLLLLPFQADCMTNKRGKRRRQARRLLSRHEVFYVTVKERGIPGGGGGVAGLQGEFNDEMKANISNGRRRY